MGGSDIIGYYRAMPAAWPGNAINNIKKKKGPTRKRDAGT